MSDDALKSIAATQPMLMLADLLEQRTGQVLSENRMWRIETSLGPVMRAHGLKSLDALVAAIYADRGGVLGTEAVDALLNNETSFFRDSHIFTMIGRDLIPAAMEHATAQGRTNRLRIWCAGCSTGQEAWSLAMTFQNGRANWPDWTLHILATDISHAAIATAQSGVIAQMEAQRGLPVADMLAWMKPEGECWRISPVLRDMIDFRVDNLLKPQTPSGDYDLILCRNVLLYFTPERKQEMFALLARHSAPGARLLLGAGETTIGLTTEFAASARHRGIYERIEAASFG